MNIHLETELVIDKFAYSPQRDNLLVVDFSLLTGEGAEQRRLVSQPDAVLGIHPSDRTKRLRDLLEEVGEEVRYLMAEEIAGKTGSTTKKSEDLDLDDDLDDDLEVGDGEMGDDDEDLT